MSKPGQKLSDTTDLDLPAAKVAGGRPLLKFRVDLAALSDRGKTRPNNEDHYLAVEFGRFLNFRATNLASGSFPEKFEERGYGFAVADGMGGEAGGEVASGLALSTLVKLVLETPDWIMIRDVSQMDEVERRMAQRLEQTSEALEAESSRNPELHGMGTTMTLAMSLGENLLIGHVGDSRAYLYRQGRLLRLTRDHTFAQALADSGIIPLAEVEHHKMRNMLTRCLGCAEGAEAEFRRVTLQDGDRLLLCSDGLTELVDDAGIAAILLRYESSQEACRALVDGALNAGGTDNVTVVLARYVREA
jgi:protein phosphatase